jgi:hypothetical protein
VKLIRNIAGFWVREGDLDQEQVVSFYGLKHKWILKGEHISVHLPGILGRVTFCFRAGEIDLHGSFCVFERMTKLTFPIRTCCW